MNLHWVDHLPSGVTDTAHYEELRRSFWHEKCLAAAKQSVNARATVKQKKTGIPSLILTKEYTKEDAREEKYLELMRGMDNTYYPDCWLSFLWLGKPQGDRCSNLFNSGVATRNLTQGLTPNEAVLAIGSRSVRKRFHESVGRGADFPTNKRTAANTPQSIGSSAASTPDAVGVQKNVIAVIAMLKDEIKLMEELQFEPEEIRVLKLKLLGLLKEARVSIVGDED